MSADVVRCRLGTWGDRLEVAGFWIGLAGAAAMIVGEVVSSGTVLAAGALAALVGVLALGIGTTVSKRTHGGTWRQAITRAVRDATRFVAELI